MATASVATMTIFLGRPPFFPANTRFWLPLNAIDTCEWEIKKRHAPWNGITVLDLPV